MIGIVSTDKLLGTLRFEFAQVYMAPHAGLCDLDNRNCDIGAMVGHSLAVYQKIGQVNAKLRTAFTLTESFDMLIPDLSSEIIKRCDLNRISIRTFTATLKVSLFHPDTK